MHVLCSTNITPPSSGTGGTIFLKEVDKIFPLTSEFNPHPPEITKLLDLFIFNLIY